MKRLIAPLVMLIATVLAVAAWVLSMSAPPPESPPAAAVVPPAVGEPTSVRIDALGLDEPLRPVGLLPDGAMQTPPFGQVGWYRPGPVPGAAGGAVIVAHVHGPRGDDIFAHLGDLSPGARVVVRSAAGQTVFVVDEVVRLPKEQLPYERIWPDNTTEHLLSLVTCGGKRTADGYPDNTIVFAHARSSTS